MNTYVTGAVIKALREQKNCTQQQLADQLHLSAKTISKWETGKGLPDITLLEPLAAALGVSVIELMQGEPVANRNRSGNMHRVKFYVCPVCGNVHFAAGESVISCCGLLLPSLEPEPDTAGICRVQKDGDEYTVTVDHPMDKGHYISWMAYQTADRVDLVKLYPEQDAIAHFFRRGRGKIYIYCNRDGLTEVPAAR